MFKCTCRLYFSAADYLQQLVMYIALKPVQDMTKTQQALHSKLSEEEPTPCSYTTEDASQAADAVREWSKMLQAHKDAATRFGVGGK